MKERSILFSGPMVRAILEGCKTQTRRVVKPQPSLDGSRSVWHWKGAAWDSCPGLVNNTPPVHLCPYGVPGDRLWVRETWRTGKSLDPHNATKISEMCAEADFAISARFTPRCPIWYPADGFFQEWGDSDIQDFGEAGRVRSSRFMPRWASRILLEVTDVRVQRVQEISEEDAVAEGRTLQMHPPGYGPGYFPETWDAINQKRGFGWSVNPWVWAVSFRRIA